MFNKTKKVIFLLIFMINGYAFSFPNHILNSSSSSNQIVEGCIGDCSSCHSLSKEEAKKILEKKFDIKKVVKILVKRGYFQIYYKNSKDKEQIINLLFSKDKVAPKIIELNEEDE